MPTPKIRLVRSAPDSLGLYIRAGRIDKDLQGFVTAGSVTFFTGVVFEAKRVEVEKFFESGGGKARSAFECRDTSCCPRGIIDKLQVPARHFLYQRTRQIAGLSQIPEPIRPTECLEEYLRPASDSAIVATKLDLPDGLGQKVAK